MFGTIAIGTFVSVMAHGTVMIALPNIQHHFGSDLPTVQWVIVGYALAISALVLSMGRVGDFLGRKYMYIGGLAIFVGASAMAGFAPNLQSLIAAKVLQWVRSAMIQGNGMAAIISTFPSSERGKALGTHMSVVGSGAIAGPAIGGLLVLGVGITIARGEHPKQGPLERPEPTGAETTGIQALTTTLVPSRLTRKISDGRLA